MIRRVDISVAVLAAALMWCSAFAGVPSGQRVGHTLQRDGDGWTELDTELGPQKANSVRILARLSTAARFQSAVGVSATKKQLADMGELVSRRYCSLPELLVLEPENAKKLLPGATDKQRSEALQLRIKALRRCGLFECVEPDWVVHAQATPTDAAFVDGRLWGLRNLGQSGGTAGADVGAVSAWDITTGAPGVIVGVVDTGIRYTHQDLAGNMWHNPGETPGNGVDDDGNGFVDDVYGINAIVDSGDPMDDNGHGSHCAGTIGAVANAGGPHVGVAWQVQLMGLKFLGSDGSGYSSDAITCIDYAISKDVDILSNSWGGGGYSLALASAVQRARAAGILFVAAAGNEGNNNDSVSSYPANYAYDNVISVAALDRSDQLANFSNYGATTVDLGAPGVAIYSCVSSSDAAYGIYSGTSMATPHVSGVAALVVAQYPGITITDLRQRLLSTTVAVPALVGRCVTGGRVNAPSALSGTEDGILELSVVAGSTPLMAGELNSIFVSVNDMSPVIGATVSGGFAGLPQVAFLDNGVSPDATGGDGIYSKSLMGPDVSGSVDIVLSVSAPGKTSAVVTQTFSIVGRSANDDFADRAVVSLGQSTTTGSNLNSTKEAGEPVFAAGAGSQTTWWSWTAPATEAVTISTLGSDFDTILAIYTGASLGTLSLVGGNDDFGGLQSSVSFTAQSGVTYAVQVNGYSTEAGAIQLNFPTLAGAPSIVNEPDDVTVLVGNPFSLQVTASGQSPLSYQWYLDDVIIPGATAAVFYNAVAALTDEGDYRVTVSNSVGSVTSREAFVAVEQVDLNPDNDSFAGAQALLGTGGRVSADTSLATGESGEPNHGGVSLPLTSIWFSWVAPSDGRLNVNTFGSGYDTVLASYTGGAVSVLTQVAANDDAGGSYQSEVDFAVSAGVTYQIAVDGYGGASGPITLDYQMTMDTGPVMILLGDANESFSSPGGQHAFTVNANVQWTATVSAPWVQITSGTSGYLSGTVEYLVTAYTTGAVSRTGTITISGGGTTRAHTITQAPRVVWADYAADGVSDLAVFDGGTGHWYVRTVSGDLLVAAVNWGWAGVEAVSGDYNGDGIADLAVFDPATGRWFIRTIKGETLASNVFWGWPGVRPLSGDYDGDGIDDLAIFDEATGRWFIRSIDGDILAWSIFWGWPGVQPVPGDYDGDGLDDLAVLDRDTGRWFIRKLAGAILGWEIYWGWAGVEAVAGDYDGDELADLAVFDTSSARWFIRKLGGTVLASEINWGWPGVSPVSGDYDGDGISDLAIFDKVSGVWYILTLSGAIPIAGDAWGSGNALPVAR